MKRKAETTPAFACWNVAQRAAVDAFDHARETGTACAVVRVGTFFQARPLPVPKSARVIAIINAKKRKAGST